MPVNSETLKNVQFLVRSTLSKDGDTIRVCITSDLAEKAEAEPSLYLHVFFNNQTILSTTLHIPGEDVTTRIRLLHKVSDAFIDAARDQNLLALCAHIRHIDSITRSI